LVKTFISKDQRLCLIVNMQRPTDPTDK